MVEVVLVNLNVSVFTIVRVLVTVFVTKSVSSGLFATLGNNAPVKAMQTNVISRIVERGLCMFVASGLAQ